MADIKTELKKWLSGWAHESAYELLDFIDKNYTLSAKTDSRPGSAVWVKGAPKEPKQYFAKVPSVIEDDAVYDAVIWPIGGSEHWWCIGQSFKFSVHRDKIIAHIAESKPNEQPVAKDNARYELSLALHNILKMIRHMPLKRDELKRYHAAEAMLKKHSSIYDVLRTESQSKEGNKEREIAFAEWIREQNYKPYAGSWYLNGNNYAHQPMSTRNLFELWNEQYNQTK